MRGGEGWQLRVRDTGRGISPQQQAHLFEPFSSQSVPPEGITLPGIGLATARRLVELMGASIEVRSEPGKGTEFRVGMPSATAPHPAPRPAAAPG